MEARKARLTNSREPVHFACSAVNFLQQVAVLQDDLISRLSLLP
jgi:hypothetical protein